MLRADTERTTKVLISLREYNVCNKVSFLRDGTNKTFIIAISGYANR